MKFFALIALTLISLNLKAGELTSLEGEELIKKCQRSYECIAQPQEIAEQRASLVRNIPVYLKSVMDDQSYDVNLAVKTVAAANELSQLVLSKKSKTVLAQAQASVASRAASLSADQALQLTMLQKNFDVILNAFNILQAFSEKYYRNLETITSNEVRNTYVFANNNLYLSYMNELSSLLKDTKQKTKRLLANDCKYRLSLSSLSEEGQCGSYSFNPFQDLEPLKFMVYNKVGPRSLPLQFSMVKNGKRSDAIYSAKKHNLTLYYFTWSSSSWYGSSGTAAPSKEDVNRAVGFELLK